MKTVEAAFIQQPSQIYGFRMEFVVHAIHLKHDLNMIGVMDQMF